MEKTINRGAWLLERQLRHGDKKQICIEAGLSATTLNKIIRGKVRPRGAVRVYLEEVRNIPPGAWLEEVTQ
jgi:transcriptional regulator with XRE-family HTH domain